MRIVFFGTPELAVPSLAAVAERHEVAAVVESVCEEVGAKLAERTVTGILEGARPAPEASPALARRTAPVPSEQSARGAWRPHPNARIATSSSARFDPDCGGRA